MIIIIDRLYKHYPALAVSWDVSIWQPCPIALTNPLLVLDPAGVPVPRAVVHWGPASFCMHRELCTRALLCPCHQHSQWANSKGRWQVWCFFFFFVFLNTCIAFCSLLRCHTPLLFFSVFPQSERIFMPFLVQLKTLLSPLFGVRSNYKSASSQLAKKLETPLTLIN